MIEVIITIVVSATTVRLYNTILGSSESHFRLIVRCHDDNSSDSEVKRKKLVSCSLDSILLPIDLLKDRYVVGWKSCPFGK